MSEPRDKITHTMAQLSMRDVLQNNPLQKAFELYLEEQLCVESLHFFIDAENYKNLGPDADRKEEFQRIFVSNW